LLWPDALHLLEQLTAELAAALKEGTLPASLCPEQVWLQPTGRAQLLDVPLRDGPMLGGATEGEAGALGLLRQAAALVLEGRPLPEKETPRPMRAPLPGHAARLLHRLAGGPGAFTTLAEFQSALQAARERPAEMSRPRRGMYVALTGLLLGLGLLWMLGVGPVLIVTGIMVSALAGVLQGEGSDRQLTARIEQSCAALVSAPGPLQRLPFAFELEADLTARDQLRAQLARAGHDRTVLLQSSSWFLRQSLDHMEEQVRYPDHHANIDRREIGEEGPTTARERAATATQLLRLPVESAAYLLARPHLTLALFAFWPLVWMVWSGLTRGGIGLRLAGVRLVQGDGRPAARWRCAWRTLVVWLPLVVLLLASLYLDLWRIAGAGPDLPAEVGSLAWLAWLTWWLAVAVLPLYGWIALRWPNRGPQDALAGAYLVPR
jgi:hypothetical protein